VGSIFAVYEKSTKGSSLVSSAYVVYGPRTELVIATDKVRLYVLQQNEFSFVKEIHLQEKGKINAPGGTQSCWLEHHKKMVDSLFDEGYRLRYSGGMVPDIHQILLKGGGLFSYPNAIDKPDGKLRTLFEVIPFSNIFEKAGGEAIDHNLNRLLDIEPEELHHTTPCFFGSKYEIERVREYYGN
jgi:fructose-1,6-bisphosphatase I